VALAEAGTVRVRLFFGLRVSALLRTLGLRASDLGIGSFFQQALAKARLNSYLPLHKSLFALGIQMLLRFLKGNGIPWNLLLTLSWTPPMAL